MSLSIAHPFIMQLEASVVSLQFSRGAVNVTDIHTQIPRLTFECQLPELLSVP